MIIKIIILVALVRLLIATNKPLLCSGIYAATGFIFALTAGAGFLGAVISAAIGFVLATIWFCLLNRFQDNSVAFWCIAVLGVLIGLV